MNFQSRLGTIVASCVLATLCATVANATTFAIGATPTHAKAPPISYQDEIGDAKRHGITMQEVAGTSVFISSVRARAAATATLVTGNGIDYHGGLVMGDNPMKYYVIWYGNWGTPTSNITLAQPIVENFLRNIGGSSWTNILTGYSTPTQTIGNYPSQGVQSYQVTTDVSGPPGTPYKKFLSFQDASNIVMWVVHHGAGANNDGQYILMTSDDIGWSIDGTTNTVGFPKNACGIHHWTYNSNRAVYSNIKWAIIANSATQLPAGCGITTNTPNGYPTADAMVNIIAHEVAENVTDWEGDAWYDGTGQEVGDKCNFNFGTNISYTANGAQYNIVLNGWNFLIQTLWTNSLGGSCTSGI